MPEIVVVDGTDFIEFSNGVRLSDKHLKRLGRGRSHRALAEDLGISYIELNDGKALTRTEDFDPDEINKIAPALQRKDEDTD